MCKCMHVTHKHTHTQTHMSETNTHTLAMRVRKKERKIPPKKAMQKKVNFIPKHTYVCICLSTHTCILTCVHVCSFTYTHMYICVVIVYPGAAYVHRVAERHTHTQKLAGPIAIF